MAFLLPLLLVVAATTATTTTAIASPANHTAPWPMLHGDARHTSQSAHIGSQTGGLAWRIPLGLGSVVAPLVGADGTLYVCAADKNVYGINATSGRVILNISLGATLGVQFGALFSPALSADGGMLYVATYWNTSASLLLAYDATSGVSEWNVTLQTLTSAVAVVGDVVFVRTIVDLARAYSGSTGALLWKSDSSSRFMTVNEDAPAVGGGILYIGSYAGALYALSATSGVVLWSFNAGAPVLSCPTIGDDGAVYFGSDGGMVFALNGSSGALLWNYTLGRDYVRNGPALGSNGVLYVGLGLGSSLFALNSTTGALLWASAARVYSCPAIGADGTVYAGANGFVHAINGATGTSRWNATIPGIASRAPALSADGTLVFSASDKFLYAFRDPSPSATATASSTASASSSASQSATRPPTPSASVSASTRSSVSPSRSPASPTTALSPGAIGGIVGGCVGATGIVAVAGVWLTRRRWRRRGGGKDAHGESESERASLLLPQE